VGHGQGPSFHKKNVNHKYKFLNRNIMLYTNLKHIESAEEHARILSENENVMVICGRMGPMCIPVYGIAEELEEEYKHVKFCDFEFDNPAAHVIRNLPEVRGFMGIPFTIYYKNGKVVKATSSIQNKQQVKAILDEYFAKVVNA
jgi:thioredoxin 1